MVTLSANKKSTNNLSELQSKIENTKNKLTKYIDDKLIKNLPSQEEATIIQNKKITIVYGSNLNFNSSSKSKRNVRLRTLQIQIV